MWFQHHRHTCLFHKLKNQSMTSKVNTENTKTKTALQSKQHEPVNLSESKREFKQSNLIATIAGLELLIGQIHLLGANRTRLFSDVTHGFPETTREKQVRPTALQFPPNNRIRSPRFTETLTRRMQFKQN